MSGGDHTTWGNQLRRPFWNPTESRIRAFWRILGGVVLAIVLIGVFNALIVRPLDLPLAVQNLVSNGFAALVASGIIVVWARYIDRRPLAEYGFNLSRRWWWMLGLSILVGLLGWGGALATNLAFGWASVSSIFSPGTGDLGFTLGFVVFLLGWMCVAVWEEVIFRGILMRNAIEGLNVSSVSHRTALIGGWVVSAVLFGVLHLDQAGSLVALAFWILAGLVLGVAYLLTDELAVPIGLHFSFDFGVNNVFGLASVREVGMAAPTLVRPAFTGPDVFVGISGLVNTAWIVGIGVLTVVLIRWQSGSLHLRISPYSGDDG